MLKNRWSRFLGAAVVAVLVVIGLGFVAQPAYAVDGVINTHYQSGPVGDGVYVDPDGYCPGDENDVTVVKSVFIDSSNQTFREDLASTIPTQSGGMWIQAVWTVPAGASQGTGTLKAECWTGGVVTKQYAKATPFTVVPNSTSIHVTNEYVTDLMHVSSSTPCPAGTFYPIYSVAILIRSVDKNVTDWGSQYITDTYESLWPLSQSQNWTKDIKLDKSQFQAGKTYSLRAQCGYSSGQPAYYYDALLFTVLPNGYVAMGDSYSSGEGSFNYDLAGGNCHRSTDSYAYYLVDNEQLEPPLFTACSGAVTDDLFAPNTVNTSEEAQINHLSSGVDIVTLTIGGNDAAFSYVVNECADYVSHTGYSCSNRADLQNLIGTAFNALGGTIPGTTASGRTIHSYDKVLRAILTEAPDATVYVAGYPRLFGDNAVFYEADATAPGGYRCELHSTTPDVNISITDARWLNDQVDQLNHLISYAVEQIDSNRLIYVPATTFDQHGLCDAGSSYINGVVLSGTSPKSESLHPNTTGMDAYGYLLAIYMGLA